MILIIRRTIALSAKVKSRLNNSYYILKLYRNGGESENEPDTEHGSTLEMDSSPEEDMATEEQSSFSFVRCGDVAVDKAVFQITAPNSAWMRKIDWVHGPFPCDMKIVYREVKGKTPLPRRLAKRAKKIQRQGQGTNRSNPTYLNKINCVCILEGELENEQVCKTMLIKQTMHLMMEWLHDGIIAWGQYCVMH